MKVIKKNNWRIDDGFSGWPLKLINFLVLEDPRPGLPGSWQVWCNEILGAPRMLNAFTFQFGDASRLLGEAMYVGEAY
jgi:hypothetical protein